MPSHGVLCRGMLRCSVVSCDGSFRNHSSVDYECCSQYFPFRVGLDITFEKEYEFGFVESNLNFYVQPPIIARPCCARSRHNLPRNSKYSPILMSVAFSLGKYFFICAISGGFSSHSHMIEGKWPRFASSLYLIIVSIKARYG